MLLSALAVSAAKSFGFPLVLITVAERAVGFIVWLTDCRDQSGPRGP